MTDRLIKVRTKTGDKIHLARTNADYTLGVTECGEQWYEVVRGKSYINPERVCKRCKAN